MFFHDPALFAYLGAHVCLCVYSLCVRGWWELSVFVVSKLSEPTEAQISPVNCRTNEMGVLHCNSNHLLEPDKL